VNAAEIPLTWFHPQAGFVERLTDLAFPTVPADRTSSKWLALRDPSLRKGLAISTAR
jgi:protein gp37